ncbi:uncharacterized protein [Argopecten irradians]|uniref:uncharacterized protein n=1 Tax=Argopecten irradians TaxID=31199 RepID=UPI003711E8C0
MDGLQKKAVQKIFTFLVNYVDPLYIIEQLYEQDALTQEVMKQILRENVRHKRAMVFFVEMVDTCPFDELINCLKKREHEFVAEKLLETYHRLKTDQLVYVQPEILLLGDIVSIRNIGVELAVYQDNGKYDKFEQRVHAIHSKWHSEYKTKNSSAEKACAAEVVIHAQLAWLKFKVDAGNECDVLMEIKDVTRLAVYTKNPNTILSIVLAYQVQLLTIQNKDNIIGMNEYNRTKDAVSKDLDVFDISTLIVTDTLVHSRSYELTGKQKAKDKMIKRLDKMIDQYSSSGDGDQTKQYLSAFGRNSMLVKALAYLGMTYKGKIISAVVSDDDLKHAKWVLEQISGEFEKLERRWKMMFHVAQARMRQLNGDVEGALLNAKVANELSMELKHRFEERQNIINLLTDIQSSA